MMNSLSELNTSPAMMFLSAFSPSTPILPSPDAEGQIIRGYQLGPFIGHGGFSAIRRASSSSGDVVAVKIVRRSDLDKQADPSLARRRLNHEAEVWASLCHEHTLPLFFAEHTPFADFFFTLLCPAGSLYDILIRDGRPALPHDDVGMMFRQIVTGVRYLHEIAGYVHRDIKLENVLVDEMGVCRICDFGMTRKIGQVDDDETDDHSVHRHRSTSYTSRPPKPNLSTHQSIQRPRRHRISTPVGADLPPVHPSHVFQQGSLPYASPELLQPQASRFNGANPAQDIWALGVLLYALLTGRLPFSDSFEPRLQMKILHGVYDMPSGISRGAEHVLKGCLERSVRKRWTIAMVDEMAWGVGWRGDEDTAGAEKDEYQFVDYPRRSHSSSPSHWRDHPNPSHHEEESPQRRSKRSLSRASISTASSFSTRCTSRSISRPPQVQVRYPMSPTYDEHSHSVVSASPPTLDIGGPNLLDIGDTSLGLGLNLIPSPEPERGRRQKKGCTSFLGTSSSSGYARLDADGDVEVLVLGDRTDAKPSAIERLKVIQEFQSQSQPQLVHKKKRAESTPPASGVWPRRSIHFKEEAAVDSYRAADGVGVRGFLREPSATPIATTPIGGTRSQSVDHGHDHRAFRRQ